MEKEIFSTYLCSRGCSISFKEIVHGEGEIVANSGNPLTSIEVRQKGVRICLTKDQIQ
jgi:hypothetical protein